MEIPRNNTRLAVKIPSYANLTVYGIGCYLTVTFPIKERVVPYLDFNKETKWHSYEFSKNGKHYITAAINISFKEIAEKSWGIEDVVYHYARKMYRDLKILSREATIKSLKEEVNCLRSEEN